MTSQRPSGTLPGTRQEDNIGLRVALGAFQARFGAPKGGPKWHQKSLKKRPRLLGALGALQGAILEPFWSHFGAIFGTIFASIFDPPALHLGTSVVTACRYVCPVHSGILPESLLAHK